MKPSIIVTMGHAIHGHSITEHWGIVRGVAFYTPEIKAAGFRVTADLEDCEDAAEDALSRAYARMVRHAREIGANAVITMKYNIIPVPLGLPGSLVKVVAYGTGVTITPSTSP
jgi:uncharacterized protein YbjQ (UPF0145 family)